MRKKEQKKQIVFESSDCNLKYKDVLSFSLARLFLLLLMLMSVYYSSFTI